MEARGEVIVLSSNNYLGLASHPRSCGRDRGARALRRGHASVRFICGTFAPHHELERKLAELSGTEAALTYVSCWNANEAVIPTLTDDTTVILTDELNHASIIDAIRLSRPASKVIYPHSDMTALEDGLAAAPRDARKLIVTDGVFSMEGDLAKLPEIVELAREHDAVVVVDDSHGVGVLGETGRGTVEHHGLLGEVDVITGTLGGAGGAAGGYVASSDEVCDLLAQRPGRSSSRTRSRRPSPAARCARSSSCSSSPSCSPACASVRTRSGRCWRRRATGRSTARPRSSRSSSARRRRRSPSERLLDEGVFVTGFGFPVVPEGPRGSRADVRRARPGTSSGRSTRSAACALTEPRDAGTPRGRRTPHACQSTSSVSACCSRASSSS